MDRKRSSSFESARSAYPEPVSRLIAELSRLPGVGPRSAERLAFHILKGSDDEAAALRAAIGDVKKLIRHCRVCFNLCQDALCAVCEDERRDASVVMVVEQPKDLIALETTGAFRGVYHVLMGRIDPIDGVGPEELTVSSLVDRVEQASQNTRGEAVREVILGMNPTLEGDGTALFLADALKATGVSVTRLARGVPVGGQIELTGRAVLADAIVGRTAMG
ncbi:MAG: recombination protein RecR [Phycisphaerae bacterium]|nr:recombination protein RecR [Phycisphaerae bacterium]